MLLPEYILSDVDVRDVDVSDNLDARSSQPVLKSLVCLYFVAPMNLPLLILCSEVYVRLEKNCCSLAVVVFVGCSMIK